MQTVTYNTHVETDFDSKMANFASDMDLVNSQLLADAELESYYELKNIFDYVHISPIKVSMHTSLKLCMNLKNCHACIFLFHYLH